MENSSARRHPEGELHAARTGIVGERSGGFAAVSEDHLARSLVVVVAGDQHPLEALLAADRQDHAQGLRGVAAPLLPGHDGVADMAVDSIRQDLRPALEAKADPAAELAVADPEIVRGDRKSTRLNSSHANISYAVFCLKKNNRDNLPSSTDLSRQ